MAGGRPRKELTDGDFQRLVAMIRIQCTQDEICGVFDMTAETLNTRLEERGEGSFSTLFKKHSDEGKASLRRMQWKAAEAGNPTMLVWLGKNMLGQSDKLMHGNDPDNPLPSGAPDDLIAALNSIAGKITGGDGKA
jgi:hypothetical protein